MPLAHGLELVGYDDLGGGRFQIGDLLVTPMADNLEWGLGRIEGSLHQPTITQRVAKLAVASLQEVAASEEGITTCTDGRLPLLLLNSRLHPVRRQLLANNLGTGVMMAEFLGGDFYEDPTAPVHERFEIVADRLTQGEEETRETGKAPTFGIASSPLAHDAEKAPHKTQESDQIPAIRLAAHEDCGGLAQFPAIMTNAVQFARSNKGLRSRTEEVLVDEFNPDTFYDLTNRLGNHVDAQAYSRYGSDLGWGIVQRRTGHEGLMQLHNTGPDGVHGHQEKIILWVGESVTDLALNQRLLSELGGGRGDAQAFGINQSEMRRVARIIGGDNPELVSKAMHAGVMGTHAGHASLAYNLPSFMVERTG